LLVVNTSRTLAAGLPARRANGTAIQLRPCVRHDHLWDVLVVEPEAPFRNVALRDGEMLEVGGKLFGRIVGRRPDIPFLWRLQVIDIGVEVFAAFGDPIRYSYVPRAVPLD